MSRYLFVSLLTIAPALVRAAAPVSAEEVIEAARSYLGTPYVYGGRGASGFDCSGFVGRVYADNGYELPRSSAEQFRLGEPISREDLRPGDLVFFTSRSGGGRINHVGIYLGNDEMIHASSGKREVTFDSLNTGYFRLRYAGARRLLDSPPETYVSAPNEEEAPLDSLVQSALAAEEEASTQAMVASPKLTPVRGRVGPLLLQPESTALGLRLGAGRIDDSAGAFGVLEASYFGHEDGLAFRLAAPFELPFVGEPRHGQPLGQSFDEARDYSRFIQHLRYGRVGGGLHAELGRTLSGSLGHGSLMHDFTPSMTSRMPPGYTLRPDDLSLGFDMTGEVLGAAGFVDDVFAPEVGGAHLSLRPLYATTVPLLQSLRIGGTFAADRAAKLPTTSSPGAEVEVYGAAASLELTPWAKEASVLSFYTEGAGLFTLDTEGYGVTLGALAYGSFGARDEHALRFRLAGTVHGERFLPSYFGPAYLAERLRLPGSDEAMTKLEFLTTLAGDAPYLGGFLELGYQWRHSFGLGLAYRDGSARARQATTRSLAAYLEVQKLYFPRSTRHLSLYAAYQRLGYEKLTSLLSSQAADEYLFAAASLYLSRHIAIGGAVRRGIAVSGARGEVDAVMDITVRYEL